MPISAAPASGSARSAFSRLPELAAAPLAAGFGLLARTRHDRALHPGGEVWRASVRPSEPGRFLTGGGDCEAVVRFSRAVGLPSWLPDVHGVAIRVLGAERIDILLAESSRRAPWALVPSFHRRGTYSSLAHYQLGGERVRLIGEVDADRVTLFSAANGRLTLLADVDLDRRTDETVRFDPTASGSTLRPVGPVHALRPASYRASRRESAPDPQDH